MWPGLLCGGAEAGIAAACARAAPSAGCARQAGYGGAACALSGMDSPARGGLGTPTKRAAGALDAAEREPGSPSRATGGAALSLTFESPSKKARRPRKSSKAELDAVKKQLAAAGVWEVADAGKVDQLYELLRKWFVGDGLKAVMPRAAYRKDNADVLKAQQGGEVVAQAWATALAIEGFDAEALRKEAQTRMAAAPVVPAVVADAPVSVGRVGAANAERTERVQRDARGPHTHLYQRAAVVDKFELAVAAVGDAPYAGIVDMIRGLDISDLEIPASPSTSWQDRVAHLLSYLHAPDRLHVTPDLVASALPVGQHFCGATGTADGCPGPRERCVLYPLMVAFTVSELDKAVSHDMRHAVFGALWDLKSEGSVADGPHIVWEDAVLQVLCCTLQNGKLPEKWETFVRAEVQSLLREEREKNVPIYRPRAGAGDGSVCLFDGTPPAHFSPWARENFDKGRPRSDPRRAADSDADKENVRPVGRGFKFTDTQKTAMRDKCPRVGTAIPRAPGVLTPP